MEEKKKKKERKLGKTKATPKQKHKKLLNNLVSEKIQRFQQNYLSVLFFLTHPPKLCTYIYKQTKT